MGHRFDDRVRCAFGERGKHEHVDFMHEAISFSHTLVDAGEATFTFQLMTAQYLDDLLSL
jgi:hypothetical protein